jgi:uncharacterized protein YajQ (UPF0234 family)
MAKDCSFDVVSEFDKQELVNAIDQVKRDITSRFDLKNSNSNEGCSQISICGHPFFYSKLLVMGLCNKVLLEN